MNLQTLKSKLVKNESDFTKEVAVVIENQEYNIIGTSSSTGKLLIITELKEGIHTGDSIEDERITKSVEEEPEEVAENSVAPKLDKAVKVNTKAKK